MQDCTFERIALSELLARVQAYAGRGARFVQMHAEHAAEEGRFNLVYTFIDVAAALGHTRAGEPYEVSNLLVEGVDALDDVPSISRIYPAVFPFENEAHDLFGIHVTDMQVDFGGYFYRVATTAPMSVVSPEVKAAREKAAKVRAAKEAKARAAAKKEAEAKAAEAAVELGAPADASVADAAQQPVRAKKEAE